jgi:hypothetical protein
VGNANVIDWSRSETAAIAAATGAAVWHEDGTRFVCQGKVALDRKVDDGRSEPWPVRCRYRGIGRYDRTTGAATYDGLDVTLEGFDVPTGTTTWSVPMGAAEAFMKGDVNATPLSDREVLVQAATRPVVVDLANGRTRRPATGERFWCNNDVVFEYRESRYYSDGTSSNSWRGGSVLRSCTADGSPAAAMPKQLPPSVGATVGSRTAIATDGGLVAFDRTARST